VQKINFSHYDRLSKGDWVSNEVDWAEIVGNVGSNQYEKRIQALKSKDIDTSCIERTIQQTIRSFNYKDDISFVVFGEPQSGKTEMMIALNAKLLDDGCEVIINLLTDSVDLLQQNLSRFRKAGLSPSPKQFSELPTDPNVIKGKQWVIFSKKNAKRLG
jgi:primosomal protein N'